jgi:cytochrome c-type biogenesis protein
MEAWLVQTAPQFLTSFSLYGYGLVFLAGIVTSIGPCNLSTVPVIIGYVAGTEAVKSRSFMMSLLFTLGTATTFTLLGLIIALVGGIFGTSQSILYYIVAAVCIAIGLNLVGVWKFNISFGGDLLTRVGEQRGYWGSYVLGLVMGLVGSQCGTPILLAILSLAMASGQWLYGATLLFVYALGRGVPIVAVGTFTGLVARMDQFARWNAILEKAAGVLIILVGGYFAWIA